MSSSDIGQTLAALLALEPEEVRAPCNNQLQAAAPLPSFVERVELFLREILGAMASELIAATSILQTDALAQENSALFMPLFALLVEGVPLREEAQKVWCADPQVRNEFERLKLELQAKNCGLGFNALAAAAPSSENAMEDRGFEGGSVRIRQSSRQGQIFAILRFEAQSALVNLPSALLLEGPEGELVRLELAKPDADGQIILVKDLANDEDALLIRLLRNPYTIGTFLA